MPREDEDDTPYEVRLSEPAEAEIDAIYLGRMSIGERSGQQWHKKLLQSLDTLSLFPYAYPLAPGSQERGDDARQMIFGKGTNSYRVIYRVLEPEGDSEGVVRIIHVQRASRPRAGGVISVTSSDVSVIALISDSLPTEDVEASYREMAADRERETEALEWCEGLIDYYEDYTEDR